MKLNYKQMEARYEALAEAAGHLRLSWTDDPVEFAEGLKMAARLDKQADKWLIRSRETK